MTSRTVCAYQDSISETEGETQHIKHKYQSYFKTTTYFKLPNTGQ